MFSDLSGMHGFASRPGTACHFTEAEKIRLVEEVERRKAIVRARSVL